MPFGSVFIEKDGARLSMQVYVLLDSEDRVFGVVTDLAVAEEWMTFDDDFAVSEGELNDYTCFNMALEAVTESCAHLRVLRAPEPA
jgi:hypothetical protein